MRRRLYLGLDPSNLSHEGLVHLPLIKVEPLEIPMCILENLASFSHLLFTSQQAVRFFFSNLEIQGIACPIQQAIVVGPFTEKKAVEKGLRVQRPEKNFTAEGVVSLLQEFGFEKANILYPHSARSRPLIKEALHASQIPHESFPLYQTHFNAPTCDINLEEFDEVLLTSPSVVEAFFHFFPSVPKDVMLTPIGPITGAKLRDALS